MIEQGVEELRRKEISWKGEEMWMSGNGVNLRPDEGLFRVVF